MYDVGDWITPALGVSPADGTTVASLSITDPDGTVTAGTGEATTDTGSTWTADPVEMTAAGLWVLTWTVTGKGKSVEQERVIVAPAATPIAAASPPTLATISDLVETLGRSLTAVQSAKAPRALKTASAKLRTYCRREFTEAEDVVIKLRPVGMVLRLPNRPVVEVAQVEQIGTSGTANRVMSVSEWAFDGIDQITLGPCPTALTGVAPTGSYANTYQVTYSYSGPVPQFINDKAVEMVLRTLLAPTETAGLVSERIGAYSYQYGQYPGGQSPGPTVTLTKEDKRELVEAGYRRTAGTIQTRAA